MKNILICYVIILMASCNTGSSSDITNSIKDSIGAVNAQISKNEHIKEYLGLEFDLVYLEITRRRKLDTLFNLNRMIKQSESPKDTFSNSKITNEIQFIPDKENREYSQEFEDLTKFDTAQMLSKLKNLNSELLQISIDSNRIYNKMTEIILIVPISEINAFKSSQNSHFNYSKTSKGCSDQRSYDEGYSLAADQIGHGLMADCNYLYNIAITQKDNLDHYCFCRGVNDWIAQHQR